MKLIPLTKGYFAQVDDEDYDWLMQWKWQVFIDPNNVYARRDGPRKVNGKRPHIWMHRLIMDTPDDMQCDHGDHNGLNNQRLNLENCSRSQNQFNRRKKKNCSSIYVGVTYEPKKKLYRACIRTMGVRYNLGRFKFEEDAARAYDRKAIELFGKHAHLNFK
jgi:hypothetical protein